MLAAISVLGSTGPRLKDKAAKGRAKWKVFHTVNKSGIISGNLAPVPDVFWSKRGHKVPVLPPSGDMFLSSAFCKTNLRQQEDIHLYLATCH